MGAHYFTTFCEGACSSQMMRDLIGKTFWRLTVVARAENKAGAAQWSCVCECGKIAIVKGVELRRGHTKSCGCLSREKLLHASHGHANGGGTRIYRQWADMLKRCTNPANGSFQNYGGRGIKVCERWLKFENFLTDMGEGGGLTLDRIDNNGNYEPGNCRWATIVEQARNTRRNKLTTANGKTQCIAAWAEELSIPYPTLQSRIRRGWGLVVVK